MNNPIKSIFKFGAAAAVAVTGLSGCMLGRDRDRFDSDGLSAFVKEENESMGQVLGTTPSAPAALAKGAADSVGLDTVTGEIVVTPLHYESACACFVRRATLRLSTGFTRQREDTIQFFPDSNSTATDSLFQPRQAAKIVHKRHVTRVGSNGRMVDLHFNTDMRWGNDAGQIVGIWNGEFTGAYENVLYGSKTFTRTATVTGLKRPFLGLGLRRLFGPPTAGTIHVEGVLYNYDIVIDGPGLATVTITRLRDQKQFIIKIDVNNQEREG